MNPPEHVYFAVMGVTGAGKSTFIATSLGDDNVRPVIGHGLQSCTQEVEEFQFRFENEFIVHLIDTPGFDDTNRSDAEVLKDIANWMASTYKVEHKQLSGILFLHAIKDTRIGHASVRNLRIFQALCGEQCYPQIALATTHWEQVDEKEGMEREIELRKTFWAEMCSKGSRQWRHYNTRDSAMTILRGMIAERKLLTTAIQRQMVEDGMPLQETSAGKQLNADLIEAERRAQTRLEIMRAELQAGQEENRKALELKISQLAADRAKLHIDLERIQAESEEKLGNQRAQIAKELNEIRELKKQSQKKDDHVRELNDRVDQLKKDLEDSARKKTSRPTSRDNPDSLASWIEKAMQIVDRLLSS